MVKTQNIMLLGIDYVVFVYTISHSAMKGIFFAVCFAKSSVGM